MNNSESQQYPFIILFLKYLYLKVQVYILKSKVETALNVKSKRNKPT
jgi:hypothetical protein